MKLNNHSYIHITIRKLCYQLEQLSGMTLITDLNEDFKQLTFKDKLGYIVLDNGKNACLTLAHRLTKMEIDTIDDIMTYLNWLESSKKVEKILQRQQKKVCNKNVIKKITRKSLQKKDD